jgi:hypothetical protein
VLRIFLVTALVAGGMFAVKDERLLARAGLVGSCSAVAAPAGHSGAWQACKPGRLEGRPNLSSRSCSPQGVVGKLEYWSCPVELAPD